MRNEEPVHFYSTSPVGNYWSDFMRLWNERVNVEPRSDLISMMAHSDACPCRKFNRAGS
jgi:exonuclease V gamma subunit